MSSAWQSCLHIYVSKIYLLWLEIHVVKKMWEKMLHSFLFGQLHCTFPVVIGHPNSLPSGKLSCPSAVCHRLLFYSNLIISLHSTILIGLSRDSAVWCRYPHETMTILLTHWSCVMSYRSLTTPLQIPKYLRYQIYLIMVIHSQVVKNTNEHI